MKITNVFELKDKLDKNEILLIDVRENIEYQEEYIPGSVLIPLSEISLEKISDQSKEIIIHCKSGKRSLSACDKLLDENPDLNVSSLDGGIIAWKNAGFITKSNDKKKLLSLDRQVQIFLGLVILITSILGCFVDERFYFVFFVIGLGLVNAGATGWCGMAKLISKMPWNK